jgi:hypothetical protein
MAMAGSISVRSCVAWAMMPLLLVHVLQDSKDYKDDETKLNFLKNALSLEWPEEKPACRAEVLRALALFAFETPQESFKGQFSQTKMPLRS